MTPRIPAGFLRLHVDQQDVQKLIKLTTAAILPRLTVLLSAYNKLLINARGGIDSFTQQYGHSIRLQQQGEKES